MPCSLLLAIALAGSAGAAPAPPATGEPSSDATARARRSVVTLVARSSAAELIERLGRELGPGVRIHLAEAARQAAQQRIATGIVLDRDAYVASSASFAIHGGPFRIRLEGGAEHGAELVGLDLATDVALFKSALPGLEPAPLADPGVPLPAGAILCVVGGGDENRCAQKGRLHRAELNPGAGRNHDYLALDIAVPPGSAGAAVLDSRGHVVGMVSALRQGGGTLAVPTATVRKVADALRREGAMRRGWLGLNVVTVTGDTAPPEGVPVAGVVPGSPAERAGLRAGDVVTRYGDEHVTSIADFVRRVAESKPGDPVIIHFLRDGQKREVRALLTERPAPERVGGVRVQLAPDDRGWLGINTQPLTEPLRQQFGAPAGAGTVVSEVVTEGPAALGGVLAGDVVLALGGERIAQPEDLTRAVRTRPPGTRVALEVMRRGRTLRLPVTLGRRPAETWLGQIPQFHLAFGEQQWRAITGAIGELPEDERLRRYEDVRSLLEQASPSRDSRRQLEELRSEMERLAARAR